MSKTRRKEIDHRKNATKSRQQTAKAYFAMRKKGKVNHEEITLDEAVARLEYALTRGARRNEEAAALKAHTAQLDAERTQWLESLYNGGRK